MNIELSNNRDQPLTIGAAFGKWEIHFSFLAKKGRHDFAYCLCNGCGEKYWVNYNNLKRGLTTGCNDCGVKAGSGKRNLSTWGYLPSELEQICLARWYAIRGRCENPKDRSYPDYGARGIRLSEEFADGRVFAKYVVQLPEADKSKEIDRIDNEKGYERGNLKWSSRKQQCRNQRTTNKLVFRGEEVCATAWAEEHSKFTPSTVGRLAKLGLTGEEILARELVPGLCPRKRRSLDDSSLTNSQ